MHFGSVVGKIVSDSRVLMDFCVLESNGCRRIYPQIIMTSSNGNIFRVTGPLCVEFTGHRWIPRTKASDAELWDFFHLRLNKQLNKQSWGWWFKTLSRSLWRHCNVTSNEDDVCMSWGCHVPGPRFTNGFSIAIQIRWKFRFTLISILIQWSLQNFVHGTTAVLSWHVQKFVAIWWSATELQQGEVFIELELRAKNR